MIVANTNRDNKYTKTVYSLNLYCYSSIDTDVFMYEYPKGSKAYVVDKRVGSTKAVGAIRDTQVSSVGIPVSWNVCSYCNSIDRALSRLADDCDSTCCSECVC